MKATGIVYLVGAGPGDVGLLTLRGAEVLGRAEVVVHDALVNKELLRLAPTDAEIIYAGKRPNEHVFPQAELNKLLIERARAGKCVVRLKGGDPYVFGRGGEEAEGLAAARIPFEVIAGVSSFVAGPSYAGIPLTHREYSSTVTLLTGHEDPSKPESALDFAHLAKTPGTIIIMMGTQRIGQIAAALMAEGKAPATPVGMVRWATTGRQQVIEGTLADIAEKAAAAEFTPPSVTVIGEVVKLRGKLNWFEKRPLFGRRVVVTRARDQASQLRQPLAELGAEVLEVPTIKIAPPEARTELAEALTGLADYQWIVFTSANGVAAFFDYFFKAFEDLRSIGGVRVAAVGPGTAAKLKELHLAVDVMPEAALGSQVAAAMNSFESVENLKILLARAERANPELPKALTELGAIVDDVGFYRTVPETEDRTGAAAKLLESGADWITFTSASTVEHFHARFDLPKLVQQFPRIKLASIGPETSKAITALGLKPAVEAKQHTVEGLVKALATAQTA